MTASAQRAAEPSMEEILASIRRIIADDTSRTRMGPAKLVSVSGAPTEKLVSEAPPTELEPGGPQAEGARALESQSFGEGREAFSAPAPAPPSAEIEPAARVPEESASLVEENRSPKASGFNFFSAGINPARPLPPDARALSMPTSDNGPRRAEFQASPTTRSRERGEEAKEAASEISEGIETAQVHDGDVDVSYAPLSQPEGPRQSAHPEIDPDLSSPSPRLAQACADIGEVARSAGVAGSRLQPRNEEVAAILSSEADRAVTRAFSDLNRGVLSQNARSLEEVVKEMLRPQLKAWLDDNLPRIVERLVRMEIERVARGRPE